MTKTQIALCIKNKQHMLHYRGSSGAQSYSTRGSISSICCLSAKNICSSAAVRASDVEKFTLYNCIMTHPSTLKIHEVCSYEYHRRGYE
eukprot:m.168807 g.168807  ORF g.168807 m.168807 type:complete len:89 (-) comp15322_c0_seq12:1879-2145(-)